RGEAIPLLRLSELLQTPGERRRETAAVIAEVGQSRAALAVDELVAREQVVVKPFDAAAGMRPYFSGVTLLADGRPALVLDPMTVL
ncbi:MAG TPA: chemotaxis protein CheW, partial [Longimicrobiales bacterium]